MPYVNVNVHVDASEVLDEMDDQELQAEIDKREKRKAPIACAPETDDWLLEKIYEHFRNKTDNPRCLQEFIYRRLGRILP